ncbi:MAG TPA: hypothetical protein DCL43_06580, partial [Chitinophagaceae bacterium]|nr:hypothetical protein [Chitinophagaceae bacterium]
KKGEIRFGLAGLKGVGEAAIENIVAERKANGPFASIFDFIKRVNQRVVNKRSLEALAYSGAFDGFELHRAQYFFTAEGDKTSGLEKIVAYGQMVESNKNNVGNTLFGDLGSTMD